MKIDQTQTGYYFLPLPILDLASVYDRQLPQDLWVANYNGVLTESLFLEGQYSQRHFTFENAGSQYTDLDPGNGPLVRRARSASTTRRSSARSAPARPRSATTRSTSAS